MTDAEFTLRNDPPRPTPRRFANNPASRQTVLFDGLDCLPGQTDLFPSPPRGDGPHGDTTPDGEPKL